MHLKNPKDLSKAVEDLIAKNTSLQKEIAIFQKEKAVLIKQELKGKIVNINGVNFLGEIVALDANSIKDILFQLKGEINHFFAVIGGNEGDKCTLNIIASDEVIANKGVNAGNMIRSAAKHIQGGGGGQPFFATAGGKNSKGLIEAIEEVKNLIF